MGGVIAQDVEKVAPRLISSRMVKLHPEARDRTEIKVVNYSSFIYAIINSVQEIYQKWLAHESEIKILKNNITNLQIENTDQAKQISELKAEDAEIKKELAAIKQKLGL